MTTVDKIKARRFVFDPDDMTAILESVVEPEPEQEDR